MQFLRSFEFGEENPNVFGDLKDDNGSNTGINFDDDDSDIPNDIDVDSDVPAYPDEVYFIYFFVCWLLCLAIQHLGKYFVFIFPLLRLLLQLPMVHWKT